MYNYRYSRSSNQFAFRSHQPLTLDQIERFAPSVLAEEKHESRGERYAFIPTSDVLRGLQAEGFQPFEVRQTKTRDEGKRAHTKHLIRLRHADAIGKDGETPEIILLNSHDGTSSFQLLGGFFRAVCSNGLIAGSVQNDVRIRHTGNVVNDVVEGSFRVLEDLQEITQRVDTYKSIQLDRGEQLALAAAALPLRWETDEDGKVLAPVKPEDVLQARRFEDRKDDLWTTFNRVQENVLKGGLRGRGTTGKRTTTREVQGVNENVRLNRALWTLADQLAAYKGEPVTA